MSGTRVLAIGAHPDDIELGCGGTLARHVAAGDDVLMLVLTDGQSGPGEVSGRRVEARAAAEVLGADISFGGLMDGSVDPGSETVQLIERAIVELSPSVVYTHGEDDSHQDHRHACAATLSAARNISTVLHYQSPSARNFHPTLFVAIGEQALELKLTALECHSSQVENSARVDFSLLEAQARYWGAQARTKYAEGFVAARALVSPTSEGVVLGERRGGSDGFVGADRRDAALPQAEALARRREAAEDRRSTSA